MTRFDAIVLAGGAGTRLGGIDKPGLVVGTTSLLDRVLTALTQAQRIVVVGPPRESLGADIIVTRENPSGGGPLAAVAAGLRQLGEDSTHVVLAAGDLAYFTRSTVERLTDALTAHPAAAGAVLRDGDDRRQWLASCWRTAPLRAAMPQDPRNAALYQCLRQLPVCLVDARERESFDVDTEADLRRARRWASPTGEK